MAKTDCDFCCDYLELARNLDTYRQGVLQAFSLLVGCSAEASTSFGALAVDTAKAAPGVVKSIYVSNMNAAVRYFQLHNKATDPVNTDVPLFSFPVPAGTATNPGTLILGQDFFTAIGTDFTTGVAWAVSSTNATLTLATASDHNVTVIFK